jgi:4-hydroxy-3-methylbut-2-enyl diphosphate reductase
MGVKRAMQLALETAQKQPGRVFTCGPLIHNPQAVEYLKNNGVAAIADWQDVKSGTIIIRAHGMPDGSIEAMQANGLATVDATCPHVVTSQKKIKKYSNAGFYIIIVGDPQHPEIQSLQSFAANFSVISSIEEAHRQPPREKIMVIAQTTFNAAEFHKIAAVIKNKCTETTVCNSICQATSERQKEITALAQDADAVIIVGGRSSANTRRLAEIAAAICPATFHIDTASELQREKLAAANRIVISAGASTPDFITDDVITTLKSFI